MKKYDVFGLGNALMDVQAFIPGKVLNKLKIKKGVMHLIDEDKSREVLNSISNYKTTSVPGGSCANTMSAIAMLGGKSVYTGIVTDDMYGRLYESKIAQRGVKTLIRKVDFGLTGTSIILTTEDAERTMNTHLGVCREYSKDDIDLGVLSESNIFHCTGYQWDTPTQKEAVEFVMANAKKFGLKISFDIADPFCIERNVDEFKKIISNYVDILFGNKDESKILTGKDDPIEAGKEIIKMGVKIAVVKVGSKGSYIFSGDDVIKIDIYPAEKVLDSTGCGDIYGGGFLYGYSKGYDITKCGKIASYMASSIISVPGVQLESLDFDKINKFINENILK
ncbi:MAG TPA: adenosine kinase [Spirochaetota bacterium]|nr:adenosine kinase [Spirochaetota bacterium]